MTLSAAQPSFISDVDFRRIAESIPHLVWLAAPDGSTEYLNRQGVTYTGRPPEAAYGWDWVRLVHPEDVGQAQLAWEHATRTLTPFRRDYRIRRFDGQYRWHAFRGLPVFDELGLARKWIGTATDIEDSKRSDNDLRLAIREADETLKLLETLQSKASIGFALVDRDFRIVRINETLAALKGSTAAEQIGKSVAAVVPHLWPQCERLYHHVLDTGEAVVDAEVQGHSGIETDDTRHWLTSYYPVSLDDEVIGVGVVVVDITERKKADDARRQLVAMVEGSGDAIFGVTTKGMVTSWNAAAERLFGYTADEIIGESVAVLAPPRQSGGAGRGARAPERRRTR